MNNKIEKLIYTSIESFEGNPWLGDSLMRKLNSIDYNIVNRKLPNSNNSIAIIVQHIINWRIFMLKKLEGNHSFDIELNSDEDWTEITIKNKFEWNELLKNLKTTQKMLIKILKDKSDDKFLDKITPGRDYTFEYLIEGIIQHDTYHCGQIGLIYSTLKTDIKIN